MTQQLHAIANQDTPTNVTVPPTWAGLLMWLVGRLGVAVIAFAGMYLVYQDYKEMTIRVIAAFEQQARVNADTSATVRSLQASIEVNTAEIRQAHQRVGVTR